MSGGEFDYNQYTIGEIADRIQHMIDVNGRPDLDEYGYRKYSNYSPAVIQRFRQAVHALRRAQIYAHRVDWFVSGDDGEDSFLERLNTELLALQEEKR